MEMIHLTCDVLVIGGGVAGVAAAVAAARTGAHTILAEASDMLGGTATAGLNCSFEGVNTALMGGINAEIIDRLRIRNAVILGEYAPFSSEDFQQICFELLEEAGVQLLFGISAIGVQKSREKVVGVDFYTKGGPLRITSHSFVDASGDGDIAFLAGAPYELGDLETGEIQPVSILFRMGNVRVYDVLSYVQQTPSQFHHEKLLFACDPTLTPPLMVANGFFDWVRHCKNQGMDLGRDAFAIINTPHPGEVLINATRLGQINALDPLSRSEALIKLRQQVYSLVGYLKSEMPGFSDSYVIDIAPSLGVRETRRIKGLYQLTAEDIINGREFKDCIARNFFPIDIHGPKSNPGGYQWILPGGKGVYDIPLRCLIPMNAHQLFLAGRCISSTHQAHGSTRTMPCCIATGQAAGVSAALSKTCNSLETLTSIVQETLRKQGVMI